MVNSEEDCVGSENGHYSLSIYVRMWTVHCRSIIGLTLLLCLLAVFAEAFSFDYDNNIGFMKNVPKDLKEAFPMCDTFLDVKWIRDEPDGLWIGKALVDTYEYDVKKRLGWLIGINTSRHWIQANAITEQQYHDMQLEEKIKKANKVRWRWANDDVREPGFTIFNADQGEIISKHVFKIACSPSKWVVTDDQGLPQYSITHFTRNVCVATPKQDAAWLVEPIKPFFSNKMLMKNPDMKRSYEQLQNLIQRRCQLNNTKNCDFYKNIANASRMGFLLDADGDRKSDYVNGWSDDEWEIAFLNDRQPFMMLYPKKCKGETWWCSSYLDSHFIKKQQQCIAAEKKIYKQGHLEKQ
jgi:hypothetical protein